MAKTIDHLDLVIKLSEGIHQVVEHALDLFLSDSETIVAKPVLQRSQDACYLRINSFDLVNLLGYLNPDVLTELEQKRLFRSIEKVIAGQLGKTLNSSSDYHYKWCLTAIHNFEMGRHLPQALGDSA